MDAPDDGHVQTPQPRRQPVRRVAAFAGQGEAGGGDRFGRQRARADLAVAGTGRGGKAKSEQLEIRSLNNALASRAKKGKETAWGFKPDSVLRVE